MQFCSQNVKLCDAHSSDRGVGFPIPWLHSKQPADLDYFRLLLCELMNRKNHWLINSEPINTSKRNQFPPESKKSAHVRLLLDIVNLSTLSDNLQSIKIARIVFKHSFLENVLRDYSRLASKFCMLTVNFSDESKISVMLEISETRNIHVEQRRVS